MQIIKFDLNDMEKNKMDFHVIYQVEAMTQKKMVQNKIIHVL